MTERASMYADYIHAKGVPLNRDVGFIDCTKIKSSHPG